MERKCDQKVREFTLFKALFESLLVSPPMDGFQIGARHYFLISTGTEVCPLKDGYIKTARPVLQVNKA